MWYVLYVLIFYKRFILYAIHFVVFICIVIQFSTSLSDVHLDWTTCNMIDYYLLHSAMFTKTSPPVIWSYSLILYFLLRSIYISSMIKGTNRLFNSWSYIYSYLWNFRFRPQTCPDLWKCNFAGIEAHAGQANRRGVPPNKQGRMAPTSQHLCDPPDANMLAQHRRDHRRVVLPVDRWRKNKCWPFTKILGIGGDA